MPGGHGQQVADAHGFEIGRRFGWAFVGEKLQHLVVDAEFAFRDREADRSRCEALAEGVQLVVAFRVVGAPPAFGDDVTVAEEHDAMDVFEAVEAFDEREDVA